MDEHGWLVCWLGEGWGQGSDLVGIEVEDLGEG
jgi:hypothetical protein